MDVEGEGREGEGGGEVGYAQGKPGGRRRDGVEHDGLELMTAAAKNVVMR